MGGRGDCQTREGPRCLQPGLCPDTALVGPCFIGQVKATLSTGVAGELGVSILPDQGQGRARKGTLEMQLVALGSTPVGHRLSLCDLEQVPLFL